MSPNLIIWFGACKDRRMNQLGSTDLYLGRPAVLFDCASRIERQKFDFSIHTSNFTCAEPNAYVTHKLYKLYLSQRSARSIDLACAKDFILNKMAGKEECACSSCFETTKYTCLRCERFKKRKNLFLMCTRTSNRQKLSNAGYTTTQQQSLFVPRNYTVLH